MKQSGDQGSKGEEGVGREDKACWDSMAKETCPEQLSSVSKKQSSRSRDR